jgi:hypothetical protein
LDIIEPLEPSILHSEHCKALFLTLLVYNENDPLEVGPRDVAQERGELLYHFAVLCAYFDGCLCLFMLFILSKNSIIFMCFQLDPIAQDTYNSHLQISIHNPFSFSDHIAIVGSHYTKIILLRDSAREYDKETTHTTPYPWLHSLSA